MKSKFIILFVVFLVSVASHHSFAEQNATAELLTSNAVVSEQQSAEPISIRDTIVLGDSVVVVHTVCAPICSSCARVYNKEWKLLGYLTPPFKSAFPEAYIEDGKICWRDNDKFDYQPVP